MIRGSLECGHDALPGGFFDTWLFRVSPIPIIEEQLVLMSGEMVPGFKVFIVERGRGRSREVEASHGHVERGRRG